MNKWMTLASTVTVAVALLTAAACSRQSDEATPVPVSESRPGGIEGTVVDDQGRPVAGMRVGIISGTAAFPEVGPETDEKGYYQIGGVPPGTFQVAVHDRDGRRVGLGGVDVTSGETATLDFTVSAAAGGEQASASSAKIPTDGLCLPAVALAVSVGDTWTISGPVKLPEGFPTELPLGAAEVSTTFTVDAIGTTTYSGGQDVAPIDHPTVQLRVTNVVHDADGNVLSTEADPRVARGGWTPVSVKNVGPVLTPDWECHEKAWLDGWPPNAQPSIGERVLSSGVTAVVFTVRLPLLVPDLGIDGTTERHHGYDRLTGREVLREVRHTGTRNGAPFNMEMLMELQTAGARVPASQTGPGACQEYLVLSVSFDGGETAERGVVTSYRCLTAHVDSTAKYPSKSPSLVLPHAVPLSLRMAAEQQPLTLDVRLYSGAGISGSFGKWPEELLTGVEPVESLQPTPSLTFQYLAQQPPGDYSLVVRATWDGPIEVFYAISLRLQ